MTGRPYASCLIFCFSFPFLSVYIYIYIYIYICATFFFFVGASFPFFFLCVALLLALLTSSALVPCSNSSFCELTRSYTSVQPHLCCCDRSTRAHK